MRYTGTVEVIFGNFQQPSIFQLGGEARDEEHFVDLVLETVTSGETFQTEGGAWLWFSLADAVRVSNITAD